MAFVFIFYRATRLKFFGIFLVYRMPVSTSSGLIQVRNLRSFVICTVYRPPDVPVRCFDTDLTPTFIAASLHNKPIHILGDLNCNLLNPDNPDSGALLEFCRLYNLSQMVKTPTRVTASTKTLIDVILSSNAQQVRETIVKLCSISDHDIVCATLRNVKSQLMLQQGASNITSPINFLLKFRKYPGPFWTFSMNLKIN